MSQLGRMQTLLNRACIATALLCTLLVSDFQTVSAANSFPYVGDDVVFAERDGLVAVEAEHCYQQTDVGERAFYLTTAEETPEVGPDGDPAHVAGASGGAYLEILPDTRRTHADKLIHGTNFAPKAGAMTIAHYRVHFKTPGRYYVWVRAFSTGSEDNGLHVGMDGEWPESGQRLQWCQGKQTWRWESKQRTEKNHCGEPHKIFLDVREPGVHTIHFSMREDGFEFDKWLMTTDRNFQRPEGTGPETVIHHGKRPDEFTFVQQDKRFPPHWGQPPAIQTRDYVPLPGGYGHGSSTLANWIQKNLNADKKKQNKNDGHGDSGTKQDRSTSPTKAVSDKPLIQPRQADGDGTISLSGEQKKWHKVTLTLDGPYAHEQDNKPNPFTDYRFEVEFSHPDGQTYRVPGYFAADGNAAESSAEAGTQWRVHFAPDAEGEWSYKVRFVQGKHAALDRQAEAKAVKPFDGQTGTLKVAASDKSAPDLRALGRLQYVGKHYLQFADSGTYFLKVGADAPETFLAYADFDNTHANKKQKSPLKTWKAHVGDWKPGDPTWQNDKGKGMIGAINYLSEKGCNAFSFLPYNAGGDGDNVWPFIDRDDKLHYDCSKLDQWGIVFDHGTSRGMYLHFKMQETENDDHNGKKGYVPESLDGGNLGPQRKLYCRELIARFGHNLALNWNLGEENTQTTRQQQDMIDYIVETDPYDHNIVIHTYPNQQDKIYGALLGDQSQLTGVSLQNSNIKDTHEQTLKWVRASSEAGKPWIVAFDESGSAAHGQCPDIGYQGFDGRDSSGKFIYTPDEVRKQTLWGTLMAGGAGCEYYFGYKFAENDLLCEDWRSRDQSWDYCRIAINFFHDNQIPFHEMRNRDELVGNPNRDNSRYCFAKSNAVYLVYLPNGGAGELDLSEADGEFQVSWFNPRTGGELADSDVRRVQGGSKVKLGQPPRDQELDWLVVVRTTQD